MSVPTHYPCNDIMGLCLVWVIITATALENVITVSVDVVLTSGEHNVLIQTKRVRNRQKIPKRQHCSQQWYELKTIYLTLETKLVVGTVIKKMMQYSYITQRQSNYNFTYNKYQHKQRT
eukprot:5073358-Amphidinium_carterae.1